MNSDWIDALKNIAQSACALASDLAPASAEDEPTPSCALADLVGNLAHAVGGLAADIATDLEERNANTRGAAFR